MVSRQSTSKIRTKMSIVILGDGAVGKTCILRQYSDGEYKNADHMATIGIDYASKTFQPKDVD